MTQSKGKKSIEETMVTNMADYYSNSVSDHTNDYTLTIDDSLITYGDEFSIGDVSLIDSADTITIDLGDYTTDTLNINLDHLSNVTFEPTMWEDRMPDPQKLKRMCEQYPALEKVYENFKTVYSMVEQDWKGNHDDEDELPF